MFNFTNKQQQQVLELEQGIEEFSITYMPARDYAKRTRKEYEKDLQDLKKFLEGKKVGSWTVVALRDLQQYFAELERHGLKASSRRRKTFAVKTFFQFLYQSGYLREDSSKKLIPPSVPKKEPRFLSETEYKNLRAQITNPRDKAIVEILLQTGITLSELTNMKVADVELPETISQEPENVGFLNIQRGKHGKVTLPLNWRACEAIADLQKQQGVSRSKALFISRVGTSLTQKAVHNLVKKYMNKARIQRASVRTLRHTMATHYLARGGDLKSVQEMLGHESTKSTAVYLDLAKKVQRKMVQELSL